MSTEEFELDLNNFELSERKDTFFEKVSGLLKYKLRADKLYRKVGTGILNDAKYESFGNKPMQEGGKFMKVDQLMEDAKSKIHLFEALLKSVVEQAGIEPNRLTTWPLCTTSKKTTREPSNSSKERSKEKRQRSELIIQTPSPLSTTWPLCTTTKGATRNPSNGTKERSKDTTQRSEMIIQIPMAVVYDNQGNYEKALEWYNRALEEREVAIGNHNPDTLNTVNNVANMYFYRGNYAKALYYYKRGWGWGKK